MYLNSLIGITLLNTMETSLDYKWRHSQKTTTKVHNFKAQTEQIHLQYKSNTESCWIFVEDIEILWELEKQGNCWDILFPSIIRCYAHKVSPTRLSKYVISIVSDNMPEQAWHEWHANVNRRKLMNYKQLRIAENGRNNLPPTHPQNTPNVYPISND